MFRSKRIVLTGAAPRKAAVLLLCLSWLPVLLSGCNAPAGKQIRRDLEVALALRQIVMFPESDVVTQVVVNDNRPGREGFSNVTISESEEVKAILAFLNDREAAWKPYRGRAPRRPIGVTLHYKGGYQHIGTGDGCLYTRLDGGEWVRELSYLQQERFLDLLEVDHSGEEEVEPESEPEETDAEQPETEQAESG